MPALSDLMRLDLIVEVSRRPAPEYRFRHGLVQEVAYGSLLEPARRSLHRRIGEAHRDALRRDQRAVYGPLARHFAEADEPERAARYSLLAGDAARAVYADHEAIEHYRRARTFLRRLDDPARERDTLFKIALVRHLAFDYARAGQAYDAAFDCSTEERAERALDARPSIEIALVRPDSYAPGDTYSSNSAIVIEQLFRGLLRIDHDLNVVPELAQNMNVSADGLTYLFMLREDACWSDGHPLTAGDFVYAWRRLREEGHVTAFLLDDIASAEALDDWTLEVHLREPRNYFPYVLASHWAYPWPRHRADEVGAAWRRPESLVGNGPFVLAEVTRRCAPDARIRTGARPPGNVGEVRIVFRGRDDERAARRMARRALRSAARAGRPGSHAADTIADRSPTLSTHFLGFNVGLAADGRRAGAPGARPRHRHRGARGRGAGRRSRCRHAAARSRRSCPATATAPGCPTTPSAPASCSPRPAIPGGAGLPELRVDARPWSPTGALAEQLAAIGVRTRFETPGKHFGVSPETHAWFSGWHADYPDPDGFYLGLLKLGLPLHRDDETDAILAQARASRDRDERLRLYREFERIWIGQRAALVPISYDRQLVLRRPERARPAAQPDGRLPPRAGRRRAVRDARVEATSVPLRIVNGSDETARLPWMSAASTSSRYLSFRNAALFQSCARMKV